jgi:hypothetical protein
MPPYLYTYRTRITPGVGAVQPPAGPEAHRTAHARPLLLRQENNAKCGSRAQELVEPLHRPPARIGEPVALGIAGAQHQMAVVELAVVGGAECQQVTRALPAAAGEEADVVELRPAAVEAARQRIFRRTSRGT